MHPLRVIVFGDLQAHTHGKYSTPLPDGKNSRLQVALNILDLMHRYALKEGIRTIFFVGDLFETKNRVPMVVVNRVYAHLSAMIQDGIDIIAIPGNHDHAVVNGSEHGLAMLEMIGGQVFHEPESRTIWLRSGDAECPLLVTGVPYRRVLEKRWFDPPDHTISAPHGADTLSVLLAHGNMESACDLNYDGPQGSLEPHEDWIRREWIRGYDYAFIGHYHSPREQKIHGCKVIVPGCPWQENAGARGEDRGFWVIDLSTGESDMKKFSSRAAPVFLDCHILENDCIQYPDKIEGNIVLLRPQHSGITPTTIREAREELSRRGAIYVETTSAIESHEVAMTPRTDVDASNSPGQVLDTVLKSGLIDLKECTIKELRLRGQEIIECSNLKHADTTASIVSIGMHLSNFMCYGEIRIELTGHGLVGVGGVNMDTSHANSNGSGKSSILDGISWMLYGKPLRSILRDEIINRNASGCRGLLWFEDSMGNCYEIFRSRSDKDFKNSLYLSSNPESYDALLWEPPGSPSDPREDLRGSDASSTQKKIAQALGMSYTLFRALVVMEEKGDGRANWLPTMSDTDQKKLFGEIMGVEMYEELAKNTRAKKSSAKRDVDKEEANVEHKQRQLEKDNNDLRLLIQDDEQWRIEKGKRIELARERLEQVCLEEKRVRESYAEAQKLIPNETEINDQLEALCKEMDNLRAEHRMKQDELKDTHRATVDKIQKDYEKNIVLRSELQATKKTLYKDRGNLIKLAESKVCKECNRPLEDKAENFDLEKMKAHIQSDIDSIEQKLSEQQAVCTELSNKLTSAQDEMPWLSIPHPERAKPLQQEIDKTVMRQRDREALVREANSLLVSASKAARQLEQTQQDLERIESESSPHARSIRDKKKDIEFLVKEIASSQAQVRALSQAVLELSVLEEAFGPRGAPSLLFDTFAPVLNAKLAEYSYKFCGSYLSVQMETQSETGKGELREKINWKVSYNAMYGTVSYNSLSGGERARANLPILFAFQDAAEVFGCSLGFSFLDEAFENVDSLGSDGLIKLLNEVGKRPHTSSVFVVTHDESNLCAFSKRLIFQKKDGMTSMHWDT